MLFVTYNGIRMCAKDAARLAGIPAGTVWRRIHSGWSKEDLFIKPGAKRGG